MLWTRCTWINPVRHRERSARKLHLRGLFSGDSCNWMAQLISTGCKREQAEQSWVSGLVLANTGTSLAQPCCAHRLIGSEPWHVSTEPFSCLFTLFPLLISIFIPSSWSLLLFLKLYPSPALSPMRMLHYVVHEWCHHWRVSALNLKTSCST